MREPAVEEAGIGWISANRAFLDGTTSLHYCAAPRRWERHEPAPAWTLPAFPFHPNAVLARTDAALEAGGWPAVISCEDMGWALAMSELFAGASTPHVVTGCRTWPDRVTVTSCTPRNYSAGFAGSGSSTAAAASASMPRLPFSLETCLQIVLWMTPRSAAIEVTVFAGCVSSSRA